MRVGIREIVLIVFLSICSSPAFAAGEGNRLIVDQMDYRYHYETAQGATAPTFLIVTPRHVRKLPVRIRGIGIAVDQPKGKDQRGGDR